MTMRFAVIQFNECNFVLALGLEYFVIVFVIFLLIWTVHFV